MVAEMSESYIRKLREKKLTRAFFDSLQHDSDELKLLLESGVFGRCFCKYYNGNCDTCIAKLYQMEWNAE